jgi:dipeptidyl aminopeptidase/acylaminoacyl peptidase
MNLLAASILLAVATPSTPAYCPHQESTVARTPAPLGPEAITLDAIMADPEWIARSPESPWWADDSSKILYRRESAQDPGDSRDVFEYDLATGETRLVPDAELSSVAASGGRWSSDRTARLFGRHGDLFLLDAATLTERQLTRTAAQETALGFVGPDPLFERGGALLVRELASGLEYQLVDLRGEDPPDDGEAEGEHDGGEREDDRPYRVRQQERLLPSVARARSVREAREQREREQRTADPTRAPEPIHLGAGVRVLETAVSPDGRWLLASVTTDARREGSRDTMPVWITESADVETRSVRAHVGDGGRESAQLRLIDLRAGTAEELSFESLPELTADRLAFLDTEADGSATEPRAVSVRSLAWSPDGARAVGQLFSHDNKDRWTVCVEPAARELRLVEHRYDEAWIGWAFNQSGWLDDGRLWFLSEASGWSQLYLWDPADGTTVLASGGGAFEVSDVTPAPDGSTLFYRANAEHPGIHEVWRLDTDGGAPERVTALGGRTEYVLSPDGSLLCLRTSFPLQPPELYWQPAEPDAAVVQLTDTVEPGWLELPWIPPRIVDVPSSQGRPITTRVYLPPDERAAPPGGRPLVLFVHGAGYLQNAHFGWSTYFREFMFHSLLAHRGYVVLDMDYRASSGYGRDWRTAIYRRMGTPELEDLIDGVEYAVSELGVDRDRVGVYGGSYGGFMALMALFKASHVFAAGAALRPVTDWAHYNHGYTANILNTPERDPGAYERSSPIEFAEGLEDPLLICHGLVDDNVLAKDSIRLAQRLIELGKDDWELALFPVEPHGFREPASWRDEYARILELFETHVRGAAR